MPVTFNGGTCASCIFWNGETGECRRNPPVIVSGAAKIKWPAADAGDWCGEYTVTTAPGMSQGPHASVNAQRVG